MRCDQITTPNIHPEWLKKCNSNQSSNGHQLHLETRNHCLTYKNPHNLHDLTFILPLSSFIELQHCLAFYVFLESCTKIVSTISFCPCWSLYLEALVFSFSLNWPHFCHPAYNVNFSMRTSVTNNLKSPPFISAAPNSVPFSQLVSFSS